MKRLCGPLEPQDSWESKNSNRSLKRDSSIGDGGSGPCCAKNPTQKKTGLTGNPKVKYFRNVWNAKVKWEIQKMANQKNPKIPRSNISEKRMGKKLPPKSGKIKIRKMWKTGIRKKFFFNQKYNQ